MASEQIDEYYNATEHREPRDVLVRAATRVLDRFEQGVAIDCGCGAGSDIRYLRSRGFEVFGFDLEAESIRRCETEFGNDTNVHLFQSSFTDFDYPAANLLVADASLFFCPTAEFPEVWGKISRSLVPGGIFVGGFLGPRDTMASEQYDSAAFWPDVMTVTEHSLKSILTEFEIVHWVEHELDGKTAQGEDHHWHIFAITIQKR